MFGLSSESARSAGNGKGTDWDDLDLDSNGVRGRNRAREHSVSIIVIDRETGTYTNQGSFSQRHCRSLCEDCQALHLCLFYCECTGHAAVVLTHLSELSGDLA
jgi:hypothetical protein